MNTKLMRVLSTKSIINYRLKCYSRRGQLLETQIKTNVNNIRNFSIDFESYLSLLRTISSQIANSDTVNATKESLISLHESTGISWALEIALITLSVRAFVTFPLSVSQQKILAKYESLKPEMNRFGHMFQKEVKSAQYLYNWSPIKAKLMHTYGMKQEMKRLIIRDNCHPMKASIVVWFQMPVWVIFSHSIRNMAFMYPTVNQSSQLVYNQLSNEGILWFVDLTQTDPLCLLPFLMAFANLAIVQLHSNERLRRMGTKTKIHTIITNFGRALSLVLIPIGLQMPSAVSYYWFISSTMGLIQTFVIYDNRFKRFVGIPSPPPPHTLPTPPTPPQPTQQNFKS